MKELHQEAAGGSRGQQAPPLLGNRHHHHLHLFFSHSLESGSSIDGVHFGVEQHYVLIREETQSEDK